VSCKKEEYMEPVHRASYTDDHIKAVRQVSYAQNDLMYETLKFVFYTVPRNNFCLFESRPTCDGRAGHVERRVSVPHKFYYL
jgi:hypothetical protein